MNQMSTFNTAQRSSSECVSDIPNVSDLKNTFSRVCLSMLMPDKGKKFRTGVDEQIQTDFAASAQSGNERACLE